MIARNGRSFDLMVISNNRAPPHWQTMPATAPSAGEDGRKTPVVVELFTSQGCDACPAADALLGQLAARPEILALSFHVSYWDYIGWRDRFAIPQAVARQRGYMKPLGQPM